ncbi:MAG TPA: type II secretion system minor pseudopilin GspK [Steroidobacteraceae bacterium]|nr:type II secretion system minor pseudopilin GspK [Steroidobacteraceae bacterium]
MALLVAILIVALGTVIAAAVAYENAMTARRGTATYAFDQAVLIHQGAEAIAAFGLRQIVQQDAKQLYIGQGWDKPYGPLEVVPGVMLEASLEDLQGRFNLNSLVTANGTGDAVQMAAFTKLLEVVGLEPKWTGYIVDWIDYDLSPQNPDGAEDSVYMGQDPPYRTANRYITSASELLALPGFGRDRYLKLAPYVTALPPTGTVVNLCTASAEVLNAYLPEGKTEFADDELAKTRQNTSGCFPTIDVFQVQFTAQQWSGAGTTPTAQPSPLANQQQPGTQGGLRSKFGQTSHYFRLKSFITIGSTEFNQYSLLYQDATQMVRPIQRSFTPD